MSEKQGEQTSFSVEAGDKRLLPTAAQTVNTPPSISEADETELESAERYDL